MASFDENLTYSQRYKRTVTQFFDQRSSYDTPRTIERALPLLDLVKLRPGQKVLDMATGTGIVAIAAAQQVGRTGRVVGVDFSAVMLSQARQKIAELRLENIALIQADAETVSFETESFDVVFCSSALVYWTDIPSALRQWFQWLKPGGVVAFSAWSDKSDMAPLIIETCQRYNITLDNINEPTGTPEKCRQLLLSAGFEGIFIDIEQQGRYIELEKVAQWNGEWFHPMRNPLEQLSAQELETIAQAFATDMHTRASEKGVWIEHTAFYVIGCKPETG